MEDFIPNPFFQPFFLRLLPLHCHFHLLLLWTGDNIPQIFFFFNGHFPITILYCLWILILLLVQLCIVFTSCIGWCALCGFVGCISLFVRLFSSNLAFALDLIGAHMGLLLNMFISGFESFLTYEKNKYLDLNRFWLLTVLSYQPSFSVPTCI